jgi:hypothetical protein
MQMKERFEMTDMVLLEPLEMDFTKSRYADGWDYEPAKFKPIARLAWWFLEKTGAVKRRFATSKVYRFREPKASKDINEAVFLAIKDRIRHGGLADDYAVIMGHETFRDLMQVRDGLLPMGSQSFRFSAGPFSYRGEMFNVPVHVVETVKGVALIPRVIIEKPTTHHHANHRSGENG